MTKWINKIFNIIVGGMLIFSIINGAYLALDPELQAQYFGWYNSAYAWVNATWSGVLGLGGGALLGFMAKARTESDDRYITLKQDYLELRDEINDLKRTNINITNALNKNNDLQLENNKLQKVNLEAKISNVLIDAEVKRQINEVLGHEKED